MFSYLRYSPLLPDSEDDARASERSELENISRSKRLDKLSLPLLGSVIVIITVVVALSSGLAGYRLGSSQVNRESTMHDQDTVPRGTYPIIYRSLISNAKAVLISHVVQTFNFNQSFAEPPREGIPEPIWDALIPSTT